MKTIKRNVLSIIFSQIGAWGLLIVLYLFRPLNILLFPAVNNRPVAFTISIWLIQTLIITNIVTYIINCKCIKASDDNALEIKMKSKKFAILNIFISICHVILFCLLFLMVFGTED